MIFLNGHGTRIQVGRTDVGYGLEQAMAAACGYDAGEVYPDPATIPLASLPELVQMREHGLSPYTNLSPKNVAGV